MRRTMFRILGWGILMSLVSFAAPGMEVSMITDPDLGKPALYGLDRIAASLREKEIEVKSCGSMPGEASDFYILAGVSVEGSSVVQRLRTLNAPIPAGKESLTVQKLRIAGKPAILLCGSDSRGLMYAALDAAGRIECCDDPTQLFHCFEAISEQPYISERAVSAYTMQRKYFESRLYDAGCWRVYFDLLARSRINSFVVIFGYESGGFMAPLYPYFFDLPEYPEVKLYGMTPEVQEKNIQAFRTMMEIAHVRGIEIAVGIWDHIYRGGVQGGGIPGASEKAGRQAPHLVSGITADNLISYTKLALQRLLEIFPEIDAVQFRMHGESGLHRDEMEGFWHDIFASIKQLHPDMKVDLRAKELPDAVIRDAREQGLSFRVATKYWMEQMGLPFHPTHVNLQNQRDRRHGYADLMRYPKQYDIHWRLWNGGTSRLLLWGDPDYVRRFANSARTYGGDSFEINEMLATWMLGAPHDAEPSGILNPKYQYYRYEFERYWYFYQVWGRVGYNPDAAPDVGRREFEKRFGKETGSHLMEGLHLASRVLPRIVAACYPYSYFPTTRGWAEMMCMGDLPRYAKAEGSDIQQFRNFEDYAKDILSGEASAMRTPLEISRWFNDLSDQILAEVQLAEKTAGDLRNHEMISTLTDLNVLANLARYHAHRIPAAVNYNLFQQSGDLFALDDAIACEKRAIAAWEDIVKSAGDVYPDDLTFGVHAVGFPHHWKEELKTLKNGLQKLEYERREAEALASKVGTIAHVPVRKLSPGDRLTLRLTAGSPSQIHLPVKAVVNGIGSAMHRDGSRYTINVDAVDIKSPLSYYFKLSEGEKETFFPGGLTPSPVSVAITDDDDPPRAELEKVKNATPFEDLAISAAVDDPSGVHWVHLRYRHAAQFEDYQTVDMRLDAATGLYTAVIPGDFIVPEWDLMYFAEAMDAQGNGSIIPDLDVEAPYVMVPLLR